MNFILAFYFSTNHVRRCTHVLIPRWQRQDSSGSKKLSNAIESLWDVLEFTLPVQKIFYFWVYNSATPIQTEHSDEGWSKTGQKIAYIT